MSSSCLRGNWQDFLNNDICLAVKCTENDKVFSIIEYMSGTDVSGHIYILLIMTHFHVCSQFQVP